MKKHEAQYQIIDDLCGNLIKESIEALSKPKKMKKIEPDSITQKINMETNMLRRKLKEQTKEEQQMIQYIHDRLVVMQIETQSQPFHKLVNQNSCMMESSMVKNSCDEKKLLSPQSNSVDYSQTFVKPYPYIRNRVRRHVAKRPKKLYAYDKNLKRNKSKRAKRNKRLRQTYFATSYNNAFNSFDMGDQSCRKKRLIDSTIDMYFPVKEEQDEGMQIMDEV